MWQMLEMWIDDIICKRSSCIGVNIMAFVVPSQHYKRKESVSFEHATYVHARTRREFSSRQIRVN